MNQCVECSLLLRTFDHFWCTDGNWGIFFSSNFHTPPVTTPVTNLGHVQIHKTTWSCIYYCIVNTWVSCRRIYEIDTRPRIVVSISGRFEDVGVRSILGSWIMWKILRISNALAYIYLWVDAYFTPWDAQDSHGISVTRVREIEWLYVATIGFSCMYLATKFSTTAVETHGQWPMCTPWTGMVHTRVLLLNLVDLYCTQPPKIPKLYSRYRTILILISLLQKCLKNLPYHNLNI